MRTVEDALVVAEKLLDRPDLNEMDWTLETILLREANRIALAQALLRASKYRRPRVETTTKSVTVVPSVPGRQFGRQFFQRDSGLRLVVLGDDQWMIEDCRSVMRVNKKGVWSPLPNDERCDAANEDQVFTHDEALIFAARLATELALSTPTTGFRCRTRRHLASSYSRRHCRQNPNRRRSS